MHSLSLQIDGKSTRCRLHKIDKAWSRAWAFFTRQPRDGAQGFWVAPCQVAHTLGHLQQVDIVFLNADGTVLRVLPRLGPWRVAVCPQARSAIRLKAGAAARYGLRPGMPLDLNG